MPLLGLYDTTLVGILPQVNDEVASAGLPVTKDVEHGLSGYLSSQDLSMSSGRSDSHRG